MTETRAVSLYQPITVQTWDMVRSIAPSMWQSRLFGVGNAEQAQAIMLKGHELGLGLMASFEFVQVVEGKPALSPRGCLALIHSAKDLVEIKIKTSDAESCTVWMKRKDTGFEFERTWTMADAQRAGVVKPNSGWEKYPANMLLWRCVGFVADVVCPDLIGGLKRADELGADLDAAGNVVEGSWNEVAPQQSAAAQSAPPEPAITVSPAVTLDDLVARYGAEAVVVANEGRIPGTVEECQAVAERLAQNG
jgi:hypothetical protein